MLRTRVGYAGGSTPDATYESIGDHSEAIAVDFDPGVISFAELLEQFFALHNPFREAFRRQYRSAIFFADDKQRKEARVAMDAQEAGRAEKVNTALEPLGTFWLAEEYHQKYMLRRNPEELARWTAIYPRFEDFLHSIAVTKANAR